nr:MAG TPA: hypothetical protein [Caudoviricetes sp.]
MVDLLASGSGIPASASRLAHAMHDVLKVMEGLDAMFSVVDGLHGAKRPDATTPGLNDKTLSKREKTMRTDSPAKWPPPAERRVKELENTIRQLRANNDTLREYRDVLIDERDYYRSAYNETLLPEQSGCRKYDTQACNHRDVERIGNEIICCDCGGKR